MSPASRSASRCSRTCSSFTNLLVTTLQLQGSPLEGGFAQSATVAGLATLPSAVTSLLMAPLPAVIARRYGARRLLLLGAAVAGASFVLRGLVSVSVVAVLVWIILVGVAVSAVAATAAYAIRSRD